MTTNILQLPFRRSHPVSLSAAITQYISTKYDQHPDMFSTDLSTIETLRNSAINVQEPHSSGVRRLATYAAQLRWMGGKFPVDIGVDFTWYPAMGFNTNKSTSMDNLRFEYANILYNLAALYSQLAVALDRTTAEGLRTASNYFCQAAGVLEYLRTEAIPDMRGTPPDDMDEMTLQSLAELMLAQAQECFWQKAVKDGLKDASIARLAAKVSDYYSQAGDFGIKSDAVSTEWIHHVTAKHHHFAAAAQYRQSKDCLEKRKYGEEIARLRDSLVCVNEALKESRWINRVVLGDLNGLKNRVQEDLKRAEKDNDVIYLQPVPPKSELKTLDRASMVKARVPDEVVKAVEMLGDNAPFGPALFSKLVPYAVHVAASIYVERRDRLVNDTIIAPLEAQTSKLRDLLSSLSLPGSLSAIEKPLGLPPSILSRAETLRQASALNRLHSSIAATATLRASDMATYNEGIEQLRSEKAEDERLRARYGTDRWSRQKPEEAAAELYRKKDEFQGYFDSAKNTDDLVAKKLRDAENILRILTGSNRDLEAYVPNSRRATLTPKVEREAQNLRSVLNDVSRLETRRKRAIETLKEKARSDDINPELLSETVRLERDLSGTSITPTHFEPLFTTRLSNYDTDLGLLTTEDEAQASLSTRLKEANAAFVAARKGDSTGKAREKALQDLEEGYKKYEEIGSNCDVGRKFYNDLARLVGEWRDGTRRFGRERREEAVALEAELTSNHLSNLSLNNNQQHQPPPPPPQTFRHAQQHQPPAQQQRPILPRPPTDPMPAPQPTRAAAAPPPPVAGMWTPDMGIRFGGPGGPPGQGAGGQQGAQGQAGQWDPNRGVRFG